jgi:hypothetical protein
MFTIRTIKHSALQYSVNNYLRVGYTHALDVAAEEWMMLLTCSE